MGRRLLFHGRASIWANRRQVPTVQVLRVFWAKQLVWLPVALSVTWVVHFVGLVPAHDLDDECSCFWWLWAIGSGTRVVGQ